MNWTTSSTNATSAETDYPEASADIAGPVGSEPEAAVSRLLNVRPVPCLPRKKEGVHNVHTLGFGSGRTPAGLGRIAKDFGGVADLQGLEPGSSPTSGTVFPRVRGLGASEYLRPARPASPIREKPGHSMRPMEPEQG